MSEQPPAQELSGADKRRFRRVEVDLPGRLFFPVDSREEACTVVDLSPGGAAIRSELAPDIGTQVVLYVDNFGRFEGNVTRSDEYGFGLVFVCTASKRERTAEQLTLFLNKALADQSLLKRRERPADKSFAKFTRADGTVVKCEVADISVTGVSLKTEVRPAMGEFVLIAKIAGRVSGHHDYGISIEFIGQHAHAPEVAAPLHLAR
jgi:hypothetical protein